MIQNLNASHRQSRQVFHPSPQSFSLIICQAILVPSPSFRLMTAPQIRLSRQFRRQFRQFHFPSFALVSLSVD